ncbi:hypothetical protein [Streptomyces synnematoformans]|uniref:Uncharacterized protein n=1 Tax=Streptomyces synnematoformans TaxID=415721 RepID=A0ABP5J0J0_9ACTN
MNDTAGIDNPSGLSDYDWLELLAFHWKIGSEGFTYAAEEYPPRFENPELQAQTGSLDRLRGLHGDHEAAIGRWLDHVGMQRAVDLHNAHLDEVRKREKDACLFGIRCTDGHVIHLETREARERWAASLKAGAGEPGRRTPAALLERSEPGGAWTETPV